MLKDNALEIFLINGKTMLLAFITTEVRALSLSLSLSLSLLLSSSFTFLTLYNQFMRQLCPQVRNQVHAQLLQFNPPNLDDTGEAENEKLKQVTQR